MITYLRNDFGIIAKMSAATKLLNAATTTFAEVTATRDKLQAELEALKKKVGTIDSNAREPQSEPTGRDASMERCGAPNEAEINMGMPTPQPGAEETEKNVGNVKNSAESNEMVETHEEVKKMKGQDKNKPTRELVRM